MKNKVLFLTSLCLTFGCVSGKYKPLDLTEELNYNNKGVNTNTDTEEIEVIEENVEEYTVNNEWWKEYNNEELNKIIDLALKNNPDYIRAGLNVNTELYKLRSSKTSLFPSLSGSLGASSSRNIYEHDDFTNSFSGEFGISYEIDLYGKIRNSVSAQEFEYQATTMDRETAKLSLINNVIDLYYNIVYLKDSISIRENTLNNYKKILEITQAKYNGGSIDNYELLQVQQNVKTAESDLISLNTTLAENEQALRNLLNLKPEDTLSIKNYDLVSMKNIGVDLNVPVSVLANRPDLQASQYRLEKAFKNLKAEEKSWFPSISINGIINSSAEKARNTFEFPFILGSVAIDLPFLDWNNVWSNVKISEIEYQTALVNFKESINVAVNEVAYYYTAYNNAESIYNNSKKKYDDSEVMTQYYIDRYDLGKVELKDLLTQINSKNSSKMELIQNKYQYIKYENLIYKALNGKYELKSAEDVVVEEVTTEK